MIAKVAVLSLLCGIALAASSANQYVDNVIRTQLPQALREAGLNPAPLPNFKTYFGVRDIYNNQGEANYTRGNASHMDNLSRQGDCSGPRLFKGELTINCTLRLTQVITEFNVIIRNGSQVYRPRNMGHVAETVMSVIISGRPQNYLGTVKSFRVERIGAITSTFSGLPVSLNKYLGYLQDAYRSQVSSDLFNILQNRYSSALARAFSRVPMPRQ